MKVPSSRSSEALKIAIVYVFLGSLWIYFSDRAARTITHGLGIEGPIQTYKGWFFVLATGVLLFALVRRSLSAVAAAETRRQEERQALEDSRITHSSLFETMALGVVYLTPDGEIIDANPAAERIVGVALDQMRGLKSYDPQWRTIGETGEEFPAAEHPALVAGRTARPVRNVILGFHNPTLEQTRWIEIQAVPEFRPGEDRPFQVLATFDDVTQRKNLEEERDRLARQRMLALDAARLGWWRLDPQTDIASYDDRYREIFGLADTGRPNREILKMLHPDDLPKVKEAVVAALDPDDPRPFSAEYRVLRPDGRECWVEATGLAEFQGVGPERHAVDFVGTVADITRRKEDALRKQVMIDLLNLLSSAEDTRETLVGVLGYLKRWSGCEAVGIRLREGADYPYYETSGFPENFVRLENNLCRYDPDGQVQRDPQGRPNMDCMCGNIIQGRFDASQSFFTGDGSFWSNNTTELLRTTGESERQGRTRNRCNGFGYESVALIPLRSGNETFGLLQFNDRQPDKFDTDLVTQFRWAADNLAQFLGRKSAQDENARLEAQLNQALRLEAVGRLAGGVAHDFNNLLTTVIGNASLALMEMEEDHPLRGILERIQNAGERGARVTAQLLAFSRRQIIEPQVMDINKVLHGLEEMFRTLLGEDIDLHWALTGEDCRARVDPGQIEQVITNLCVNARDAMPDGGKLTIETSLEELGENYQRQHPYMTPGRYVMVAVSDSGEGMDAETRNRVFEPFFTTKPEHLGTGLGLSTSFGIIKQHGGHIELYSEPGQGSTFKVYLPRVDSPFTVPREPSTAPVDGGGEETILVVEDEMDVREVAIRILESRGYVVLAAASAEEALGRVAEQGDEIDLLMTDVVLPGMNGRRLAETLQVSNPGIRILFTSGYTQDVIARHGILEEGIQFVGKPYSPEGLARKVRLTLDNKEG